MIKQLLFIFLLSAYSLSANAQGCSTLGQTPSTAFPVCGISSFTQTSVPICTNNNVISPACNTSFPDANPYWYKFTCYASGTLGFLITPSNLGDDYDWQLFDITGHDPSEVYTNTALFVCCNWSGVYGLTGTADTAGAANQCASPTTYAQGGVSPFSTKPNLIVGHTYLLLISHYTNSQSGYTLSFGGGSANITDPAVPNYVKASGICGGNKIYIKLSKHIQCKTIASNGSDFSLSPATTSITAATGYGCGSSFDTDSVIVQLNNPLSPANYSITQQIGTDGNTLLDNCYNAVVVGTSSSFTITSQQLIKAAFTYQINYGCKYDTVNYFIGGQNIATWNWSFDSSASTTQSNPTIIYSTFGQHQTILYATNSVCADTAIATFTLNNAPLKSSFNAVDFTCPNDTVHFTNSSIGNIVSWFWDFGNGQTSILQQPPVQTYPPASSIIHYPVRLAVTDSVGCTDVSYRIVQVATNCYIAVPSAFTPNGDGKNDYLYPLNAYKAVNLIFRVFNRYGQLVFSTTDWTKQWDGTLNNAPQPSGAYVWILEYTERDTGKRISQKGTTVLIR